MTLQKVNLKKDFTLSNFKLGETALKVYAQKEDNLNSFLC